MKKRRPITGIIRLQELRRWRHETTYVGLAGYEYALYGVTALPVQHHQLLLGCTRSSRDSSNKLGNELEDEAQRSETPQLAQRAEDKTERSLNQPSTTECHSETADSSTPSPSQEPQPAEQKVNYFSSTLKQPHTVLFLFFHNAD